MAFAEAVFAGVHHSIEDEEVCFVLPEGRPDLLLEVIHVPNLLRVHLILDRSPEPKIQRIENVSMLKIELAFKIDAT